MPLQPDHYLTLGVPSAATSEQIRAAFKKCAFESHPDRGGTHAQMTAINQAWEILGDPEKRRQYDADLRAISRQPTRPTAPVPPRGPERRTLIMFLGKILGRITRFLIWIIFRWKPSFQRPTLFTCTRCKQKLRARPRPNSRLRCPKCGARFIVT
ncbi:MAG TPA: DnaJ domain-containing protein [Phycisphaerae bacterium]|jgi:curved DNA-binding protein CbpA